MQFPLDAAGSQNHNSTTRRRPIIIIEGVCGVSVRMRVRVWCEGVCWWHLSIANKAAGQHTSGRLVGNLAFW